MSQALSSVREDATTRRSPGAREHLRQRRQRPAVEGREHPAVHVEAGQRLQQLRPAVVGRGVDVRHLVGDVVQARALLGQEPADRRVGPERREQLDMVLADVEQDGLDALLGDDLAVRDVQAEAVPVQLDRGLDLLDGDADVVDAVEHGRPVYI